MIGTFHATGVHACTKNKNGALLSWRRPLPANDAIPRREPGKHVLPIIWWLQVYAQLATRLANPRRYIYIYGHQGAQAPCLKYVRFAYNYAYPRVYIPKIRIPNSYISKICIPKIHIPEIHIPNTYIPRLRIYTYFLHTQGIHDKKNTIPRVYIPHLCLLFFFCVSISGLYSKSGTPALSAWQLIARKLGTVPIQQHVSFCVQAYLAHRWAGTLAGLLTCWITK
jgi:hypothetical protein